MTPFPLKSYHLRQPRYLDLRFDLNYGGKKQAIPKVAGTKKIDFKLEPDDNSTSKKEEIRQILGFGKNISAVIGGATQRARHQQRSCVCVCVSVGTAAQILC